MLLIISLPHLKKIFIFIYLAVPGLPWWLRWLRICLQCRRPGFDPWVGKIPSRRECLAIIHSSVLAWRIPRTEEPDGLQSMGSQRVRHD